MVNEFDDEYAELLEAEGEKSRQRQYEFADYLQHDHFPDATETTPAMTAKVSHDPRLRTGKGPLTRLDKQRRIDFAANVLLRCHRASEQVDAICKEFGIGWRMAQRYLQIARNRILEAAKKPREDFLASSLDFYEAMAANPLVPTKDRLQARKQLDRAVGIGVGAYLAIPVPVQEGQSLTDLDLAEVARKAREDRRARLMPPSPPPVEVRIVAEPDRQEEAA